MNHFRDQKPDERRNAATEDALELAEKHNFLIISTARLHELLTNFLEGHITKEEFLKTFS